MASALLATGRHQITAITRNDSTSTFSPGLAVARVDYDSHASLVSALQGHDAFVVSIAVTAGPEQHLRLIRAAAEAKVPWILPNEWGFDTASDAMLDALPGSRERFATPRKLIVGASGGASAWIAVATGFWYEWSLSFPNAFGFDFDKKALTLVDGGEAKLSVSTWPQVGRAVAALLSLPVKSENGGPSLEQFRNNYLYPASFSVSQKDMLASVLRVTNTAEKDWTITGEEGPKRFDTAMQAMKAGDRSGYVKAMYTRALHKDEPTNVDRWRGGNHNSVLSLPDETDKLDEYTKEGIERVEEQKKWLKSISH
jgi:hypothetical protein